MLDPILNAPLQHLSMLPALCRRFFACTPRGRVLIASVPRCGSTYLLRSLANLPQGSLFPKNGRCRFVGSLSNLPNVPFLKTHHWAPRALPDNVRTVFLFGDPIRAIVSTKLSRFTKDHFRNCGYLSMEDPKIYEHDDLGYERIFDSWMCSHRYPVLALRYETLHQHESTLSHFLGCRVRLLPWRCRATSVPPDLRRQLAQVYGRFVEKVNDSPDAELILQGGTD